MKEPIVKLSEAEEIACAKALRQEQGSTEVAVEWGRGKMGVTELIRSKASCGLIYPVFKNMK